MRGDGVVAPDGDRDERLRPPTESAGPGDPQLDHRLASDGGAPAPRRPAARTTMKFVATIGDHVETNLIIGSPPTAGPQPPDLLRLPPPRRLSRRSASASM